MLHDLPLATWIPIFVIAMIFAVAGTAWAVASVRAGQYRDPEAAKFAVLDDDSHPDEPDAG